MKIITYDQWRSEGDMGARPQPPVITGNFLKV